MFGFVRGGSQQRFALLTALRVRAGLARAVRNVFRIRFLEYLQFLIPYLFSRTTRTRFLV